MAPISKHLHAGGGSKTDVVADDDDVFANAEVPVVPVDKEEVMESVYRKVRKVLKDEDLEPEHRLSVIKNVLRRASE